MSKFCHLGSAELCVMVSRRVSIRLRFFLIKSSGLARVLFELASLLISGDLDTEVMMSIYLCFVMSFCISFKGWGPSLPGRI